MHVSVAADNIKNNEMGELKTRVMNYLDKPVRWKANGPFADLRLAKCTVDP